MQAVGECNTSLMVSYLGDQDNGSRFSSNSASLYVGEDSTSSSKAAYPYEMKKMLRAMVAAGDDVQVKIITLYSKGVMDTPVVKSYNVRLLDFNHSQAEAIAVAQVSVSERVNKNNSAVGFATILMSSLVLGVIWYIKTKAAPKTAQVISEKMQEFKEKAEERQVAKIAKEETIRQTVRQSVSEANQEQIDVLKQQIKEALDKDDTKTATTLMAILCEKEK